MERIFTKPDCKICRKLYKEQEPPCTVCLPALWPSNQDAVRIWNLVYDQRIWVSGLEVKSVALKHEPVWKLIDEFNVSNRIKTFEKVILIFRIAMEFEDKKNKKG